MRSLSSERTFSREPKWSFKRTSRVRCNISFFVHMSNCYEVRLSYRLTVRCLTCVSIFLADDKSWRAEAEIDMELFHQVQKSMCVCIFSCSVWCNDAVVFICSVPSVIKSLLFCYSKIECNKKRRGIFVKILKLEVREKPSVFIMTKLLMSALLKSMNRYG